MLFPKRTKFNKPFKSNIYGLATSCSTLNFGQYGIQSLISGRISANQIEAARRVISRYMKLNLINSPMNTNIRTNWIRVFPYLPLTKKPNETRMGRGKGAVHIWYANIKANQILFEFSYINNPQELHHLISSKLAIKTKLIYKHDI
jgi:large subunit ribosomal protein L16